MIGHQGVARDVAAPTSLQDATGRPIRVLTVDDHPLFREGIAAVLNLEPDIRVTGEAQSVAEAVALYRQNRPDVVLMDIQLPDGIRVVHRGHQRIVKEVALDLTMHAADDPLTSREMHVLEELARGQTNKEVGRMLGITEETVKTHVASVLTKLHANDRTHAVLIGMKRGFI